MSRIINPDSVGKERTRLSKCIVLSIRELAKHNQVTPDAKDQAAFIALALQSISDGIDASVAAWEKRGYWVKADKFRMEWIWSSQYSAKLKDAVLADDWAAIASMLPVIAQKFGKVEIAQNHKLGKPWMGAYASLALHRKL